MNRWMDKIKQNSKDAVDFDRSLLDTATKRLRITNAVMLLLSIYLFYNDHLMKQRIENVPYREDLFKIHLALASMAALYLLLSYVIPKLGKRSLNLAWGVLLSFVPVAMMIGAAVAFNSAKLSFQINTYVTIILFIAVFIPMRPILGLSILSLSHLTFILALSMHLEDTTQRLVGQINASVTVFVSIVILMTFYSHSKNDFFNKLRLKENEESLNKLFEINPFPLFLFSRIDGRIIRLNEKAIQEYGIEVDVQQAKVKDFFAEQDAYENIRDLVEREGHVSGYLVEQVKMGQSSYVLVNCDVVEYNGEPCALAGTMDITKIKMLESELAQKAETDMLTGSLNRMKGMELLENWFTINQKANRSFGIVFCDLDDLKKINDEFGHKEGDRAIITVATAIKERLKNDDFLFRFGGDEFVIIFNRETPEAYIMETNSILNTIESKGLSASLGLVIIDHEKHKRVLDALDEADHLMYEEKSIRKSRLNQ